MKYPDLTLHQLISLKGYIETLPELHKYLLVWKMWDFVKAINFFLTEDINELF